MHWHHLKGAGVATVAVLVLVAFAGASTASATRLCVTNTNPCGLRWANGTPFTMHLRSGVGAVFTTSGGTINPTLTCSTSKLTITSSNDGGGAGVPVAVALSALTFTGCTSTNPTGCEPQGTVGALGGATGTIAWTSGINGTLRITPPTVSFSCPIFGASVVCTFGGAGTVDGNVTGGSTPIIDIVNQSIAATGGLGCPPNALLNAEYQSTVAIFVTNS